MKFIRSLVFLSFLGMASASERRRRSQDDHRRLGGSGKGKGKGSEEPTMAPTISTEPTMAPTTMKPVDCSTWPEDKEDFTFELKWFPGEFRPCAWLCWNPTAIEERKERYCGKQEIAHSCPISCGICEPCGDSDTFTFELMNYPGEMRGCDWITKNDIERPSRQKKYCWKDDVVANCPYACEKCPGQTAFPTVAPTTPEPTPCGDDSSFKFELMNFEGEERDCEWIYSNPYQIKYRQKKYCWMDEVADACQYACEECPGQPPFPTFAPTPSPTVCEDDDDFEFELIKMKGEFRSCKWICWSTPENTAERRSNYCGDDEIAKACTESCGLCVNRG